MPYLQKAAHNSKLEFNKMPREYHRGITLIHPNLHNLRPVAHPSA